MKILHRLAYISASCIQRNNNSSHINRRILYFGFQAIYGDLVKLTVIICIAAILKALLPVLTLTLAFALLRRYAGGFHMSTELKCIFASVFSFVIPGTVISMLNFEISTVLSVIISVIIFLICLFLVAKYSPKDCVNRPIDEKEAVVFRKKAIRDLILLFMLSILLLLLGQPTLSAAIITGIAIEIFTVIPIGYRFFELINSLQ
ncbi:accessory gene regulator B [Ruminiclostridium sufflavum DSM 19573]|uniref:Accessory gene regulator B n=1 Tax=Ruminiclostridium sufflavum DSM 19573 TaxID=1121337 RepID=A0A318Y020_9FIRM|nr:accessory gene regulator B family protein [Ruminiclostridium sufflavum]PYG88590.1 accessory gene regulator B [Ruminiclostridium sufflavum DSM 19573]